MFKNILYIHGFNSSGRTGKSIEKLFKEKYGDNIVVYHPSIPANYFEARKFIDEFLKTHKVDLMIGSSLGGFMTLDTEFPVKIVINPPFTPYELLPTIGAKKEDYMSYEISELDLPYKLNKSKSIIAGVYGLKDNLVHSKDDFIRFTKYSTIYTYPEMEHSIKDEEIPYLFEIAEKLEKEIKELS